MNLDEAQRKKVSAWIQEGLKLSEIQTRLGSELGLRMTYMEVRMLVDDLKLVPKDIEPMKPVSPLTTGPAPAPPGKDAAAGAQGTPTSEAEPGGAPGGGRVSISVDQITRPGAVVSGKVTFSDGNRADWYFDQTGRLALASAKPGYRPPAADLQEFQAALDSELNKLGF